MSTEKKLLILIFNTSFYILIFCILYLYLYNLISYLIINPSRDPLIFYQCRPINISFLFKQIPFLISLSRIFSLCHAHHVYCSSDVWEILPRRSSCIAKGKQFYLPQKVYIYKVSILLIWWITYTSIYIYISIEIILITFPFLLTYLLIMIYWLISLC